VHYQGVAVATVTSGHFEPQRFGGVTNLQLAFPVRVRLRAKRRPDLRQTPWQIAWPAKRNTTGRGCPRHRPEGGRWHRG